MANSVDAEQTDPEEQSDQGLQCLLRYFNSNIKGNYSKQVSHRTAAYQKPNCFQEYRIFSYTCKACCIGAT